jgi:hypothetical protein
MSEAYSVHAEMRNVYKILVGKSVRDHSEDLGVDGRITLK